MKAKTKTEIAEELKELPGLYEQASRLFSHYTDDLERQGLISPAERATLDSAEQARREIAKAEQNTKEGVPYPDYEASLPHEFVQLLVRQKELKAANKKTHDILQTAYNLRKSIWVGEKHFVIKLDLSDLAEKLISKLNQMPDPLYQELATVDLSVERKSRQGTRVHKMRQAIYADYEHSRNEAASKTRATLLDKYRGLFDEAQHIEEELAHRQEDGLKPIRVQIEVLLTKALEEMEG